MEEFQEVSYCQTNFGQGTQIKLLDLERNHYAQWKTNIAHNPECINLNFTHGGGSIMP